MSKTSKHGFIHSIKVPRIYKAASLIIKKVVEEGGSLKDLVYNSGHKNIKGLYALIVKTIENSEQLDNLLKHSRLLQNENRLQPWLAKILITELLFGKKELKGESKPVKTILSYKIQFERLIKNEIISGNITNRRVIRPRYVRVNTLYHTPDEIIKLFRNEGWSFICVPSTYSEFLEIISNLSEDSFTRDFHIKELLVFSYNSQFYNNELYQKGHILLQDKASCLPAFLLNPPSHSVALDMCAAPGMKTTHMSAIMRNKGKIYATEMNVNRFKVLCDVVKNAGCNNVTPIQMDALLLNTDAKKKFVDLSWCNDVEYILVDPSCTGSGIVDRINTTSNEKIDRTRLKKLCGFQFKLLMHALTKFPKAKRIVYSTCSIHTQENEQVVEDTLRKLKNLYSNEENKNRYYYSQFKLVKPLEGIWNGRGSKEFKHGKYCVFADPEKDLTNGFFVAVFEKIKMDDAFVKSTKRIKREKNLPVTKINI